MLQQTSMQKYVSHLSAPDCSAPMSMASMIGCFANFHVRSQKAHMTSLDTVSQCLPSLDTVRARCTYKLRACGRQSLLTLSKVGRLVSTIVDQYHLWPSRTRHVHGDRGSRDERAATAREHTRTFFSPTLPPRHPRRCWWSASGCLLRSGTADRQPQVRSLRQWKVRQLLWQAQRTSGTALVVRSNLQRAPVAGSSTIHGCCNAACHAESKSRTRLPMSVRGSHHDDRP